MNDTAQILPGILDLLILKAMSLGPLHGYCVLLRIGQISGQALLIEQGALYPALFRLVRQELLKASWAVSENNRKAKFYALTVGGGANGWAKRRKAGTDWPQPCLPPSAHGRRKCRRQGTGCAKCNPWSGR